MVKFSLGFLFLGLPLLAVQAPSALAVSSASNKQVKLTWQPGGSDANQYTVERRALDSDSFASAGVVKPDASGALATSYTDTNFDPFTTYVYRVRAVNATANPTDTSDPTNEVTAGPPPYGYNRVIATPDGLASPGTFGHRVQMTLDASGDPMLCYAVLDPNADGDPSDSEIWFVRWDRANYIWTKPVRVAQPGGFAGYGAFDLSFRIAFDPSTGVVAIAYVDGTQPDLPNIGIADSADNGATWRLRVAASDPETGSTDPALALSGGQIHLTASRYDGIRYITGKLADDPLSWSIEVVPSLNAAGFGRSSDVAVDTAGKPGVVYLSENDVGQKELFYRPGGALTVINHGIPGPGDDWQIRLTFAGTNPRVAFAGQLDNFYFATYDHSLFSLNSTDGGANWGPRVNVPSDGNSSISGPIDVAVDSQGREAIVSPINGGNSGGVVCGTPKLSLSSDLQTWKTCGITNQYISSAQSPSVRFAANDTLLISFHIPDYPFDPASPRELAAGVYFWRGPVGFQFPAPSPAAQ